MTWQRSNGGGPPDSTAVIENAAPELSVIVFAYNEADNIGGVLRELDVWRQAHLPRLQIIVVDDGSTDDTTIAAASALDPQRDILCRHEQNRGIGAAIKTGTSAARGRWVTFLPADGQIPPSAIGTLWNAAQQTGADLVLSLYEHRDDGLHRKVLSWGVRQLITLTQGLRLASDGPYLFQRSLFCAAQLPPDSFALNFEFPLRVTAAGLRIAHVTIPCLPRRSGRSKSARPHIIWYIARDLCELRWRRSREMLAHWRPG